MLSFSYISELIHGLLEKDGIRKFPLKQVEKLIEHRNNMLDNGQFNDFDWYRLPANKSSKKVKDEFGFRKAVIFYLKEEFKYEGINITDKIINKIFSYERLLLCNVGNIKSYYEMLVDLKKHKKIDFLLEWDFDKWTKWKESIDVAVGCFTQAFGVYPNVLIANSHTISQMNFLFNTIPGEKEKFYLLHERTLLKMKLEKNEEIELTGYGDLNYHVNFTENDKFADKEFTLFYKNHPDLDDDNDDDNNDADKKPLAPKPHGSKVRVKT